ncbi:MAG: hypothetical protein ACO4AM_03430, partial [Candidatus Nanopelagicaceae bacterium]
FITTPNTPIITSLILAEADTARYGYAFALCLILMAIVLTVMGLINLVVRGQRSSKYQPNVIVSG